MPHRGQGAWIGALLEQVVAAGRFRATTDYAACRQAQIVLIAVETPVEAATKKPEYRALRDALSSLGPHLARGTMVIIESTIAPGTMSLVVSPCWRRSLA